MYCMNVMVHVRDLECHCLKLCILNNILFVLLTMEQCHYIVHVREFQNSHIQFKVSLSIMQLKLISCLLQIKFKRPNKSP